MARLLTFLVATVIAAAGVVMVVQASTAGMDTRSSVRNVPAGLWLLIAIAGGAFLLIVAAALRSRR
jgi:hypothetical protein